MTDVFAILPRNVSDIYFSMEAWMKPRVLCLGGPNLDPNTLELSYLRQQLKYTDEEINLAYKENCFRFRPEEYENRSSNGIDWNEGGVSERFLQRKMLAYGWSLQKQNILPIPLNLVILRLPFEPGCLYVHPSQLIHFGHVVNSVIIGSCHITNYDLKNYKKWTGKSSDCTHNDTQPFDPHIFQHQTDGKYYLTIMKG